MKHWLIIGLIAAAPHAAAQEASEAQTKVLAAVARCLLAGLPQDWHEARVIVTLDQPGGDSGEGRYFFMRQLARADEVPFTPCDTMNPVKTLVEMRALQPPERRQWKGARFVLYRDGKFDLTYDYPKPAAKD